MRALSLGVLLVAACGGGGGGAPVSDLSAAAVDMAMAPADLLVDPRDLVSCCGHPGENGDNLGIGHYCVNSKDCMGLEAFLCAGEFDTTVHFCTKPCQVDAGACGDKASCRCKGAGCGCVPNSCFPAPLPSCSS